MNKSWSDEAWDDYVEWQNEDKKTLRKINNLIKDIERNQYVFLNENKRFRHPL